MADELEQTGSSGSNRTLTIVALIAALAGVALAVTNLVNLNAVAQDETLRQALATQMGDDANLLNKLAGSPEINTTVRETLLESINEDPVFQKAILEQYLSSSELQSLISRRSEQVLDDFRASDGFEKAVLAVLGDDEEGGDPVSELRGSLARYERELAKLAMEVRDDQSAKAVNTMQGQLVTLQRNLAGLSDQVACAVALRNTAPRTFLLKSNDSTQLPGYDLVISLSRLRNGEVDTVSVSAPAGSFNQVNTKVIGNVQMGKPFSIEQGDVNYEGIITFTHKRLFSRALIGFEIRMVSAGDKTCLPSRPEAREAEIVAQETTL